MGRPIVGRVRGVGVVVALLLFASAASSARADEDDARVVDGDERIRQARAALDDQRYEDAIRLVAPLVAEAPAKQRVQALEITAVSELILGRPGDARAPLAALYEMAPGFSLSDPSLPPRVTTEFEAEAVRPHARAVEVVIRPASGASTSFEIRAGHGTARVTLACRVTNDAAYAPVPSTKRDDRYAFELPVAREHACYGVALDADELPIGRIGTPAHPIRIAPHVAPKPAPREKVSVLRWTVLALLGTAAAVVTTTYVVTKPSEGTKPPAQLDVTAKPVGYAPPARRWVSFSW